MRVLVTGATGFLGGAVSRALAARGAAVTGLGRNAAAGERLEESGVRFVRADLRDREAVRRAAREHDAVVHSGALSSPWGRARDFGEVNVRGSAYVIEACRAAEVGRVVHVSTAGVYYTGADRYDVREDEPLPERFANDYVRSKRAAELLFEASGLDVVTLRPRALFGPGDTAIMPRLIRAYDEGRLRIPGDGGAVMDLTFIDNAVAAVLCALDAGPAPDPHPEAGGGAVVHGRTFNITGGEPVGLWPVVGRILAGTGREFRTRRVPVCIALAAAGAAELLARTVRRNWEPPLTRYTVGLITHSLTLDISAARRDLAYLPPVSMTQAVERTIAALAAQGR